MRFISLLFSCILLTSCNGNLTQARADYTLAQQYLEGTGVAQDEKKGMELLLKAANAGYPEAELLMGFHYMKGTAGLPQDVVKGVEYFTLAATHGNRDAQYNTGLAYVRGEGVEVDFAAALPWFEKAAYQDDAGAQYNLGVMHLNGEGTVADPLTAFIWFKLAYQKGYDGADEGMDAARNDMTSDQLKEVDAAEAAIKTKIRAPASPEPEFKVDVKSVPL